jgi:hypothetical protein
MCKGITIEAIM